MIMITIMIMRAGTTIITTGRKAMPTGTARAAMIITIMITTTTITTTMTMATA
jgi:hypothetical protein